MKFTTDTDSQTSKPKLPPQINQRGALYVLVFLLLLVAFVSGFFVQRLGLVGKMRLLATTLFEQSATEVGKNVTDELRLYEDNGLPTLTIDLKFKYYRDMLEKRNEALDVGILQTNDSDFVPGTISLNNSPKMDMKIRLKGDWTDHLEGKKWSFRIHLKNSNDQILGFRQFSIQSPETRNFLYEWAFHENLIKEGVLTTRYDFVNVMLNGELLGIYAIEENFATELLESQGRRQGLIFRFDEENMWNKWAYFYANDIQFLGDSWSFTTERTADISTFQSGHIAENPELSAEAENALSLLRSYETRTLSASEVFDVKLMGKFFALSDLWAACHGTTWHNLRFYFNPINGRLEPVIFDALPFSQCTRDQRTGNFIFDAGNSIFNDPEIRRSYAQELFRYSHPEYVEKIEESYNKQAISYSKALLSEYNEKDLGIDWDSLAKRQKFISMWFNPPNLIKGAYFFRGINPGDEGPVELTIELTNLSPLPIDVIGFEIDGKVVKLGEINPTTIPYYNDTKNVPPFVRYTYSFAKPPKWADPDHLPTIQVIFRLAGINEDKRVELTGEMTPQEMSTGPLPQATDVNELLSKHPFLTTHEEGGPLITTPGLWDVDGDLVIPGDLKVVITAGTVLRFDPGAVLLSHGIVNIIGTENDPILLTAKDTTQGWGGVVILEAPGESLWKYVKVENTHGISRKGWILTGGITYFRSDIMLDHAIIGNNKTEDAINVVHGKFTFLDTRFENTSADAFDADFSKGEISRCTFQKIQGDAVDISGTHATISDLTLLDIVDKGLSIGENSQISATNLTMDTVGIGVASKDLSTVVLTNSTIKNARFSGLAAYIKKPVYGSASIEAENVTIIDTKQACVVQVGSNITLNGKSMPDQDIDVDQLYAEGILGN